MSLLGWLSVAAVCALGAVSPGPSLALVLRHSIGGSRGRGVVCALTHALGVGLYALLTVLGLAAVVASQPGLYRALASAGAVYLGWLGLGLLRARGVQPGAPATAATAGTAAAARDGFAMALLNPKIAVFFLALFSQFVGPDPGPVAIALLPATALVIDGAWYTAVAIVASGRRVTTWLQGRGRLFERAMGVLLLAVAAGTLARQWLA